MLKTEYKRPQDLPVPIQEGLATWEGFRKLGFLADNIFARFSATGDLYISAKLPNEQFTDVRIGTLSKREGGALIPLSYEEFTEIWTDAATKMNNRAFSQTDLDLMWQSSLFFKNRVQIALQMAARGIQFPVGWDA